MKAFAKPSIHYNIKNVNISLGTNALICLWLKTALCTKNLSCMHNFGHGYLFYQIGKCGKLKGKISFKLWVRNHSRVYSDDHPSILKEKDFVNKIGIL